MPWRTPLKLDSCRNVARGLAKVATFAIVGCAHVNDPYKDSSAAIDADMTTASAEGFRGKAEFPANPCRNPQRETVLAENGAVSHWPLWFEDPFEDKGNDWAPPEDRDAPDNHFALTWVDYAHIFYGPGRMAVNLATLPVGLGVTPAGTLMESDGRIDKGIVRYDHDARRSDSVTREPPDVNIINKSQYTHSADTEPPDDAG